MPSQSDISSQIIATLGTSEPDLDTSVGSVTRAIIDACASAISDASLDSQMLAYQYDIYSMAGADLDSFVQLFGMSRYPAGRSVGTVTFTRATAADVVTIPVNAQVISADGTVTVQTLAAVILAVGALTATVAAQAVVAGPAGNVAAGTLTVLQTAVSEITSVTNLTAFTGGTNQETDSQLQARWVATVFKSMAGTSQMFLGIALNNPFCTAATVIGPQTRFREQLQISGGIATSSVTDAQYIYPSGEIAGTDIDDGNIAAPGIQYTWNYNANPPQVVVIDQTYFPSGELIDLSYIYLDAASRNQPAQGIFNRVDVICAGTNPVSASQTISFSSSITFSSNASNNYYVGSFVNPDGTGPAPGNIFVPLAFGPILTLPAVIVIGTTTYAQATPANPLGTTAGGINYAYQIVHRQGAFGWGAYSDFGMEWAASMTPPNGSIIAISSGYTYNDVPSAVQADLENWRLAGQDVWAHQAVTMLLQFSLAVVYNASVSITTTQAAISTALSGFLTTLGFSATIYPSSVIAIVEAVPGVVACRFLEGIDYPGWNPSNPNASSVGIQQVVNGAVTQSFVNSLGQPVTIVTAANTIPAFGGTILVTKGINTLGAFG